MENRGESFNYQGVWRFAGTLHEEKQKEEVGGYAWVETLERLPPSRYPLGEEEGVGCGGG